MAVFIVQENGVNNVLAAAKIQTIKSAIAQRRLRRKYEYKIFDYCIFSWIIR
jgi:hypothetical protein